MERKYYIAADGGGTKLKIILYDDEYRIVKTQKSEGVNENRKSADLIKNEVRLAVERLLRDTGVEVIECLTASIAGRNDILYDAIIELCNIKEYRKYNEGESVLMAAGLKYGVVAQAGTGSDVFVFQPDYKDIEGGLGYILGDEGSGYDIGLKSIKAAIASYEERGQKTLLQPLIFDYFNINEPRDIIKQTLDENELKKKIAAVTYVTEKAAKQGDRVAIDIYKNAGKELAEQTVCAIKRFCKKNGKNSTEGKIIASGGVWHGFDEMYKTFKSTIKKEFPTAVTVRPTFEPVIGCVVANFLKKGGRYEDILPLLKNNYKEYLYE